MMLPIGRDGEKLMIYDLDGKTPRVLFGIVDGRLVKTEGVTTAQLIPSKYRLRLSPLHH